MGVQSAVAEGPVLTAGDENGLGAILAKYKGRRGALISILEDVQNRYGYLPEPVLHKVAEATGRSLVDIYGVATFYRAFSLRPRGKHLVSCCLGTACHVRGAPAIVDELSRQLKVSPGETTSDKEYTLETVNCLGACALGPIVVVDGRYYSNVTRPMVKQLLAEAKDEGRSANGNGSVFPLECRCPRCNHTLMDAAHPLDGHPSIRITVSFNSTLSWARLSSLYGSYTTQFQHEIPINAEVNVFCPHCNADLAGAASCSECEAPMVPLLVRGGGVVQICSRRGCKGHRLDLAGVNS